MTEADREFVERMIDDLGTRLDDLIARHVAEMTAMQAEIDRRVAAERHEAELRFEGLDTRLQAMDRAADILAAQVAGLITRDDFEAVQGATEERVGKVEAAVQQQRGRTAAYATVGSVMLILIALLTLILNHTHL